jgi:hypothetical protein
MLTLHTNLHAPKTTGLLNFSVEALWLAYVIHDALDIALGREHLTQDLDPSHLQALHLSSSVFERLGHCGSSATPVTPFSLDWSPVSRLELIRQVAVHWQVLMDRVYGTSICLPLITTLSDMEMALLQQIQDFAATSAKESVNFLDDLQREFDSMAGRQTQQQALRCASYLRVATYSVQAN